MVIEARKNPSTKPGTINSDH